MAARVRYSEEDQKKFVAEVETLRSEGHTLNSACSRVSSRASGSPTTNTLAIWVRKAESAAPPAEVPAAESDNPERLDDNSQVTDTGSDTAPTEYRGRSSDEDAVSAPDGIIEQPTDASPETGTSLIGERAGRDRGQAHVGELVHAPSNGLEELVEENDRLRRALAEADREVRAMRDLLVVYASR